MKDKDKRTAFYSTLYTRKEMEEARLECAKAMCRKARKDGAAAALGGHGAGSRVPLAAVARRVKDRDARDYLNERTCRLLAYASDRLKRETDALAFVRCCRRDGLLLHERVQTVSSFVQMFRPYGLSVHPAERWEVGSDLASCRMFRREYRKDGSLSCSVLFGKLREEAEEEDVASLLFFPDFGKWIDITCDVAADFLSAVYGQKEEEDEDEDEDDR